MNAPTAFATVPSRSSIVCPPVAAYDRAFQARLADEILRTPPGAAVEGDRWIVPSGATGMWAGKANQIALWTDAAWTYFVPLPGFVCFIEAEGVVVYANSAWQSVSVLTANGASIGMNINEQEVVLSGATTDTNIVIPARSIVLAVSTRTTVAVTGATSYDCGTAAVSNTFGGTLGIALSPQTSAPSLSLRAEASP